MRPRPPLLWSMSRFHRAPRLVWSFRPPVQELEMKSHWKLLGIASLGAASLISAPAFAQVEPRSQEVSAYAGELFGDKLTDTAVSGQVPELDDDVTYGLRYAYNLTPNLALEASVGE